MGTIIINVEYELHKKCKNSVCYKPKEGSVAEGMTIYVPNRCIPDFQNPPETLNVEVRL